MLSYASERREGPVVYIRRSPLRSFDGNDSEQRIVWRVADSLSVWRCHRYGLNVATPDPVTGSCTRRLLGEAAHQTVLNLVQKFGGQAGTAEAQHGGSRRDNSRAERGDEVDREAGYGQASRGLLCRG